MSNYHVPSLQEFIAYGKTKHFSRADRFVVNMSVPPGLGQIYTNEVRDFNMLCEEAAFPGKSISPSVLRINALNELRAHTIDYMGDSITLQFIVDQKWEVRRFFEDWMSICVSNRHSREVGFYEEYVTNLLVLSLSPFESAVPAQRRGPWDVIGKTKDTVQKLLPFANGNADEEVEVPSKSDEVMWGMQLYEVWPRTINVQGASYSMGQYQRLNVTFSYKNWESFSTDAELLGYPPEESADPLLSPMRVGVPSGVVDIVNTAKAGRTDPINIIGNRFPIRKTVLGKIKPSIF
jgi:hypothetical protein